MTTNQYSIGNKITTKCCGVCVITAKLPNGRFEVLFEDGYKKITTYASIRDAKIKNPYYPTVFGKGFIGEGFNCSVNGKMTKEYMAWVAMLTRCYHKGAGNLSYTEVEVCEQWLNFQNFAQWCQEQRNFGQEGYALDKDLLLVNNKVYSPDVCCFLPRSINSSLIKYTETAKPYLDTRGRWQVSYYDLSKKKRTVRYFTCLEDAVNFWTSNRFNLIRELLPLYAHQLDARVLDRLLFLTQ